MSEEEKPVVRGVWGSWDLDGKWYPNPLLKMSPEEQARQNAGTLQHGQENQTAGI